MADWLSRTLDDLRPGVSNSIKTGFKAGGAQLHISQDFVSDSPAVRDILDRVNAKSVSIPSTTWDDVNRVIQRGLSEGWTLDELTAQVGNYFEHAGPVRARMIAATSATAGFEGGQKIAFKDAGVETRTWLAQRDGSVRAAHIHADGQTVGINEPFDVDGEQLEFPGDPAGSGGNVINCRCTTIPNAPEKDDA